MRKLVFKQKKFKIVNFFGKEILIIFGKLHRLRFTGNTQAFF